MQESGQRSRGKPRRVRTVTRREPSFKKKKTSSSCKQFPINMVKPRTGVAGKWFCSVSATPTSQNKGSQDSQSRWRKLTPCSSDTLVIEGIFKKAMGLCPEMKGGHCLREEFWEGEEYRGYYQTSCYKGTVTFKLDGESFFWQILHILRQRKLFC